ncbi:hypothetical protein FA95DRAFT_421634 [Auriscalpium vulgare]|uniref:Uncharacterized protein n=1 Tax=Auriscalpium vulgare TaxID=40419 RepID=A0ACB8S3I6_9AGAM|nr:hypothetical protein FA95DRAFT_421634 [Auriscalpium vulgare]
MFRKLVLKVISFTRSRSQDLPSPDNGSMSCSYPKLDGDDRPKVKPPCDAPLRYEETYDAYKRRIFLLSGLLSRVHGGSYLELYGTIPTERQAELDVYCRICTLLDTFPPSHQSIAVSGRLCVDGIHLTVVKTQGLPAGTVGELVPDVQKFWCRGHEFKEDDLERVEKRLRKREPYDLRAHIESIVTMLRAYVVSSLPRAHRKGLLLSFTFRRSYQRTADIMDTIEKGWKRHPFRVLRDWRPVREDQLEWMPSRCNVGRNNPRLPARIRADLGVELCSESGEVLLDNATALRWVAAICDLYEKLEKILLSPAEDGSPADAVRGRRCLSESDIEECVRTLELLDEVLRLPSVIDIFKIDSLNHIPVGHQRYWYQNEVVPAMIPFLKHRSESFSKYMYRCLETLVAPLDAVKRLSSHELLRKGLDIHTQIITVSDPTFKSEMPAQDEMLVAGAIYEHRRGATRLGTGPVREFDGTRHAAASLMALASTTSGTFMHPATPKMSFSAPSTEIPLKFELPAVGIGHPSTCCRCCRILLAALEYPMPTQDFKTHELILPWTPPEGLPLDALKHRPALAR